MIVLLLEGKAGTDFYTYAMDPGLLYALDPDQAERYVRYHALQAVAYFRRRGVDLDTVEWNVRLVKPWEEQA